MERTLAALTLALRHIWASLLFSFLSGLVPRDGFFKKKKKNTCCMPGDMFLHGLPNKPPGDTQGQCFFLWY